VKLKEFLQRFSALTDDAFMALFNHPFLLEEGRLALEGDGPAERQLFLLRSNHPIKIGRSASADVCLRHHEISSRHAILVPPELGGRAWHLLDANSTNGTYIDGKKVPAGEKTPLRDGVLIRFGLEVRLSFLEPLTLLQTIRKRGAANAELPADPEPDPLTGSTQHDLREVSQAALEHLDDDDDLFCEVTQELLLTCDPYDPVRLVEGEPLVLGRTPKSADVVLPHANVSRRHALVERKADGVYIKDLGSSNGCYICGVRVGSAPMLLLPGKPLEIGPFTLKLEGKGLLEADPSKTLAVSATRSSPMFGKLELSPLVDLLQAIETEEATGSLQIDGQGGLSGRIAFRRGEPHNASTNDGKQGAEAVRHLLELERGAFVLDRDETKVGEREMSLTFGEILLDDFLRGA
jgi:pSer/pThr/pTyr-binding forkhead associated (FHA) protein